jgi:diguanylate cyclase (GGDEF)-like protein
MLTLSLASLTGAIVLGILSLLSRTVAGARNWAIGLALLAFAFGSHLFFQDMPLLVRANSHNICLLLGHIFWLIGTYEFVGRPLSTSAKLWLALPVLILTLAFTFVWPQMEYRITIIGIWLIFVRLNYAWILFRYAHNNRIEKLAANIAALIALAEVSFSILYTLYGAFGHLSFIGSQISWVAGLTWFAALLGITISTPLLMLLSVGRLVEKLDFAAHHDPLTNLLNRRGFFAQITPLISISERNKRPITVMMLDIDNFKRINDKHGHAIGDDVIEMFAQTLHTTLRDTDVVARWGGEEACVLLHDATTNYAISVANRVRASFSEASQANQILNEGITMSVGIASAQLAENKTFDNIQTDADAALYRAKDQGRDCVVVND